MTRISFGIIALNAQPFLEYNLRALYPFAHEIIVVEGAVRAAASLATVDGHSTDDTLEMLARFRAESDPQNKVSIITAKDESYADGFWPEKDEMSRAYARRLTGDFLWQVDSDEFYKEEDLRAVLLMLEEDPSIATVSFPYYEFFGSFRSRITGSWHLYEQTLCHRIFRWGPGYVYGSHRPPTVLDAIGNDLRSKHWISAPQNAGRPIFMYHYSYVFPKQARQKVGYYSHVDWTSAFRENKRWLEESYLKLKRPMFLGEKGWPNLQWLERFESSHPESINLLREDLTTGKVKELMRPTEDINRLLNSFAYTLQRSAARFFLAMYWPVRNAWKSLRSWLLGKSSG